MYPISFDFHNESGKVEKGILLFPFTNKKTKNSSQGNKWHIQTYVGITSVGSRVIQIP